MNFFLLLQIVIRVLAAVGLLAFLILAVSLNPERDIRLTMAGLSTDVMDGNTIIHNEPFISFLNVDGDEIFFRTAEILLLTYSWEERINVTTIDTRAGAPRRRIAGHLTSYTRWKARYVIAFPAIAPFRPN